MNGLSSYYRVTPSMYANLPAATPGWEDAPVPGWGTNPLRAGPERIAVGGCGACRGLGQDDCGHPYMAMLVALAGGLTIGYLLWGMQISPHIPQRGLIAKSRLRDEYKD